MILSTIFRALWIYAYLPELESGNPTNFSRLMNGTALLIPNGPRNVPGRNILFGQVSTFLKDPTAFVYGLGDL